jgi:hypothetical protein
MPCPFFEPRAPLASPADIVIRYPLIFQFGGICHVTGGEHSSRDCNHGNAKGHCFHFPLAMPVSAIRFDVTAHTELSLTVLMVEEENHWPRSWSKVNFDIAGERLEPEIADLCRRSQLLHFCRSYLEQSNANDN